MKPLKPREDMRPDRRSGVIGRIRRAVAAALRRSDLRDSRIVVAVSGGQDSMALLDALHSLVKAYRLDLTCAHFDHGIRGAGSEADAEFVRRYCSAIGLRCIVGRAEVGQRLHSEGAAREARYRFLHEVLCKVGSDTVAVGHSATDRAETVLLNLIRGTGLAGLSAMREDSVLAIGGGSLRLVRPLLSLSRPILSEYCRSAGLHVRADPTNESGIYTRNRVRRSLLPLLCTFNPAVEDSLIRLARNAAQAVEFVESEADRRGSHYIGAEDGRVTVSREIGSLPEAVVSALLRRAVARMKGDLKDVRQSQVDEVFELLSGGRGRSVSLGGGLEARAVEDAVVIMRRSEVPTPLIARPQPFPVPGRITWSGWTISAALVEHVNGEAPEAENALVARLDPDLSSTSLWIRGWSIGDRIKPLGMSGTKKLQDLFVDEKVPREDRHSVPLLVCGRGIAWVAGYRIAEWAKVPRDADRWLRVRVERDP